MKPPYWKILLSYLYDIPIERVASDLHTTLTVSLSKGRYQLTTPHAIYSYADLYDNFVRVFRVFNWNLLPGDHILLLGMGLGSIPYMLEHTFHREFRYTAVDFDAQVIRLATKYVLPELKSPVTMYHTDAVNFVHSQTDNWDLICIDIFVDDVIPAEVQTPGFLEAVSRCLSPGGVVLYNCLSRTREDIDKTRAFLENVFLQVFPSGGILDVGGNWILSSNSGFVSTADQS